MAYINAYLDPCPGYGWQGGPVFSTQIVQLSNGHERRNAQWSQAKHRYTTPFVNLDISAYREIKKMHMVCRGMLHAFRFRDVLDHEAIDEAIGVGDGTTDTFQLSTTSTVDGVSYVRRVFAIAEIHSVSVAGADVDPVNFTVDMDRGLITFDTPPSPGQLIRWSGIFDVWVRFDTDDLPFSLDNPDATNGAVSLLEVAPPPAP